MNGIWFLYLTVEHHLLLLPFNHEDLSAPHDSNGWGQRDASNIIKSSELNRCCDYAGPGVSHPDDHGIPGNAGDPLRHLSGLDIPGKHAVGPQSLGD